MIIKVFPLGPFGTNLIILGCNQTKEAALIDAPLGACDVAIKEVKKLGLSVKFLLLTHSHWDHIVEAAALKNHFKVPLFIHADDAGNLEHPGSDGLPLPIDIPGISADGFFEDAQEVIVGNLVLKIMHTPGHTPGGVCFYLEEQKTLVSGDTLFKGAIGKLSFATARPALMWDSLKRLAKLPPDTKVYPGHGEPTTIKAEQWIASAKERYS